MTDHKAPYETYSDHYAAKLRKLQEQRNRALAKQNGSQAADPDAKDSNGSGHQTGQIAGKATKGTNQGKPKDGHFINKDQPACTLPEHLDLAKRKYNKCPRCKKHLQGARPPERRD